MDTIFHRIIRGQIPCHRVYEDDRVLAFLDVNPIAPGHTLVVPKASATTIADLPDDDAAALGRAIARVARAVQQATGCAGYNLLQNNGPVAGQVVMQTHVHIIPRAPGDDILIGWPARPLDPAAGADLAARIAARVSPTP